MHYKPSLWDDSEPTYAPGLRKIRNGFYWVAPKKYVETGYGIRTWRLEGEQGDGLDLERARICRAMTREMLEWFDGETQGVEAGTWGWLIQRYLHDEYSSFHDVEASTREDYRKALQRVQEGIGEVLIEETDFPRMMEWKRTMQANGRSVHYIKKWFTHFGIVMSHGVKLEIDRCKTLKAVRGEMKIKTPPKRQLFITRDEVDKVVERLDADGYGYVALATLFRFEFMLRGVDVYGKWTLAEDREGGIMDGGRMWEGGLTWEMFDQGLTQFEKVITKTAESLPEPYLFDLTQVPKIRQRLISVPQKDRVGPVIVVPGKRTPPKPGIVSRRFKVALKDCKLSDKLRISDTRSGAITEAKSMVDPYRLRDAAQHTQISTTDRYVRGRSDAANNVVKIRQQGQK